MIGIAIEKSKEDIGFTPILFSCMCCMKMRITTNQWTIKLSE
jgi:hypothetical protein